MIGAAFSGGFVLGPVVGGFLGEIGPRAPFWFAAALSGLAFLYGLLILPESLPVEKRMPFSWLRANPIGAMGLLLRNAELTGLSAVNFLLYFSHHVFSAVFVLYAMHRYGWGPREAMLPNSLWGLAMPTLQALMTRRVGDDEQGQLQGANNSVASIAGVMSPLFFGWVYAMSAGSDAFAPHPGLAFFMAAVVLAAAGLLGWRVGLKAERTEATAAP